MTVLWPVFSGYGHTEAEKPLLGNRGTGRRPRIQGSPTPQRAQWGGLPLVPSAAAGLLTKRHGTWI